MPTGWHKQRFGIDGRVLQVACLTNDEGARWVHCHDNLPSAVRRRLRESAFNVCAACLSIAAHQLTKTPSVADYLVVLEAIERELKGERGA